ncbi:hypothetical protein B0E53_04644 [Micromonospora sp. MH33]|uniref:hypothetical protein n=1 Tax=Micromonospora sp. MH33 TaxID=1945509 RepID=UPI000D149507|nr:hypothetical protein [Micromonospora sp. MH33]PSK63429.1 hypothetical protein B0E53_04644 [Micromonospora sp. MH33]
MSDRRVTLDDLGAWLIKGNADAVDLAGRYATELHGKAATTEAQAAWALAHLRRPVVDADRTARVWQRVVALAGAYEMHP